MTRATSVYDPGQRDGGFTLVEMVISVTLLATIALAVAGVLNSGLRALAVSRSRAQANEVATAGIEDLQRFNFNNLGLCAAPSGTPPAGLADTVLLSCGGSPAYVQPCNTALNGSIPLQEYTCTRNNIPYTVRRFVAWADPLHTSKRLAVIVDWTDIVGNHQVSQQSSLRAPDEAAVTGVGPPRFSAPPILTAPDPVTIDAGGNIVSGSIMLSASTANLHTTASTTSSAIPSHSPGQRVDVTVASNAGFPDYNGYPVTVDGETFTVVAGAGTNSWGMIADGSTSHVNGSAVSFAGDQVYTSFLTLDASGNPQTSTLQLSSFDNGATWSTTLDSADLFAFASGTQYFSLGILRASDGKAAAAFATQQVRFCPAGGCTGAQPAITSSMVPSTASISASGALNADVDVSVSTINVTRDDTVTVGFVTEAGAVTVLLSPDSSCPAAASALTPGVSCTWTGKVSSIAGYKFAAGSQNLYLAARQITDADPATVDQGSTAGAQSNSVAFTSS